MPAFLANSPVAVIGALLVIGAVFRMLAWTELREYNLFEVVMRQHPPFEDLSPAGQVLMIISWIFMVGAVAVIAVVYLVPRFQAIAG